MENDVVNEETISFVKQKQRKESEKQSTSRIVQLVLIILVGVVVLLFSDGLEIKTEEKLSEVQQKNESTQTLDYGASPSYGAPTNVDSKSEPPLKESPPSPTVPISTQSSRRTYRRRGQPMSEQEKENMIQKWGSWKFVDKKKDQRPTNDFYQDYPNRDVPRAEFPVNSWQVDQEYLAEFLPESIRLVQRAQKAILAEYGQNVSLDEASDIPGMFRIYKYENVSNVTNKGSSQGGWTTNASWDGLKRRLLHAIMTEDTFIFAMGGHSAAAGHGNHFQQSYTLQVQWILESVFARLGVTHASRNFGNGGLGTIHNAFAAGSIYGPDIDVLMWDSSMTESNNRPVELFHRQGLIGGVKVPALWTKAEKIAKELCKKAKIDIGIPGSGMWGIPKVREYDEMMMQPYASRYLNCGGAVKEVCKGERYDGVCWIERPDFRPSTKQDAHPGGRASWHPGTFEHQIFGRVITFTILQGLLEVLQMWVDLPGYVMDDSSWHLTNYYNVQRQNIAAIPWNTTHCRHFEDNGLEHICEVPMKGRTEFTPRNNPSSNSIRSLMPPIMQERLGNKNGTANVYEPPDVFNPSLHPPRGEVDVLSIVEAGVPFESTLFPSYAKALYKQPKFNKPPTVEAGKGVHLSTKAGDAFCDGSLDSWCSRGPTESCLLRAHNDGRNGLLFDSFSGWIVMNIPDLKYGHIIVKFETWHQPGSAKMTEGWVSINNEENNRILEGTRSSAAIDETDQKRYPTIQWNRTLKKKPPSLCEKFRFEYSIDGHVTSLNLSQFERDKQYMARVVEMLVLMKNSSYTNGFETEVEVAIRITGCGRKNTFKLTHIYWS